MRQTALCCPLLCRNLTQLLSLNVSGRVGGFQRNPGNGSRMLHGAEVALKCSWKLCIRSAATLKCCDPVFRILPLAHHIAKPRALVSHSEHIIIITRISIAFEFSPISTSWTSSKAQLIRLIWIFCLKFQQCPEGSAAVIGQNLTSGIIIHCQSANLQQLLSKYLCTLYLAIHYVQYTTESFLTVLKKMQSHH